MDDLFDSAVRSAGDVAGVFEYDGATGYFYLYATGEEAGQRVLDAIHILSGEPDFAARDVSVRWDVDEQKVGLFIRDVLWAAFDHGRSTKYGGSYNRHGRPVLPPLAQAGF